jgi:hypothetical protein
LRRFGVAPAVKTRVILAREAMKKAEAKKPMDLDIPDEGGVADLVMMAKTKRIETNIVDLVSDDDDLGDDIFTLPTLKSTTAPSHGAENIMKNSDPAEDRDKRSCQLGQQQIQQEFRARQAAAYQAMLTNEALRVEGKMAEKPVLMDLVSDENEPDAEHMVRTRWGWSSGRQGVRDQDGLIKKPTDNQTTSPTVLSTEVKDLRAEVSELWVGMRAMTTTEEEAFAEEERLAEEEEKRLGSDLAEERGKDGCHGNCKDE